MVEAPKPAPLPGPAAVSVFYGVSQYRGPQYAGRFEMGICEVTTPPARVQSATPLEREAFLGYFRQHVAASREGQVFVLVHGPAVSFEEACRRTAQRSVDTRFGGVATMFSSPRDAQSAGDDAARSAQLQDFVELVVGQTGATSVQLVAHE
jgi:esterase/lipase superfamily enzyme